MSDSISTERAGLFLLRLQSETAAIGAPILHLNLGIDTPHQRASGIAEVTQALEHPVVCVSHVSGPVIYETVMGPGSKIRLDLDGYPNIYWPPEAGIGPVIPKNFTAMVLLNSDWKSGEVRYQYRNEAGGWVHITQKIFEVETQDAQKISKAS